MKLNFNIFVYVKVLYVPNCYWSVRACGYIVLSKRWRKMKLGLVWIVMLLFWMKHFFSGKNDLFKLELVESKLFVNNFTKKCLPVCWIWLSVESAQMNVVCALILIYPTKLNCWFCMFQYEALQCGVFVVMEGQQLLVSITMFGCFVFSVIHLKNAKSWILP